MPLSLVDFWKRLLQSGMADSSTPRQWAADFARDHDSTPPSDPLTLAKWSVKTGRLNPFQAACLTRPNPGGESTDEQNRQFRFPVLRIAPLTQVAEQARPPFSRWLPVTHDAFPDRAAVVLQLSPVGLTPGDGDRLRWFASLQHAGLPKYELLALPGAPLGNYFTTLALDVSIAAIGLFTVIPPGGTLAEKCSRDVASRWTTARIVPLIQTLASAMAELEGGRLVFPPLPSLDRIWVTDDDRSPADSAASQSSAILWIDPAEYLSTDALGCSRTIASTDSRWLYTAPETFQSPVVSASSWASQSIYALGCLAYRLRFGQHAFAAAKDEQIQSRQLRFEPPELSEAVAQGSAGEPLLRVIAYALAKNPQSRFSSFDVFSQALAAALAAEEANSLPASAPSSALTAETDADEPPISSPRRSKPPMSKSSPVQPTFSVAETINSDDSSTPLVLSDTTDSASSEAKPEAAVVERASTVPPIVKKPLDPKPPANDFVAASEVLQSPIAAQPVAKNVPLDAPAAPESVAEVPEPEQSADVPLPQSRVRRPSRRRAAWLVLGSLWIPIILLIVALALQDPNTPRPVAKRMRPPIPAVIPSVTGNRPVTPRSLPKAPVQNSPVDSSAGGGFEIVSDDRMLWAPPAALQAEGESEQKRVSASMLLPPGPAALTTFNLPNLDAIGLRDAFDPELAPLWAQLQKRIAVPIEDVRLLALAWFPGREGIPEIEMAVHLKSPRALDDLTQAWEASLSVVPGGAKIYAGDEPDDDAYYPHFANRGEVNQGSAPVADGTALVDAFAVGSIARVTQVAEAEGAPVLLPRQLEELWQTAHPTDAITMLSVPSFLIADSRVWVQQAAPPLLDWIQSTLTPESGGLLVRVVVAPASPSDANAERRGSYVELRLAVSPGKNPAALKAKVLSRIDEASALAEEFLASRQVNPSWQVLATRLPSMWLFTGEQIRSAAIKREVVFNAYLPPLALPQLALGTLLAANTTATLAVASTDSPAPKLTVEELLARPMSVSFGQESLQFAVDTIVNEFGAELPEGNLAPSVEIIGADLQKNGITQNQQVRNFSKTDVPLRTVLTDLMLGANPDRTATGPSDPKQSLIWVVVGEGDEASIKITTRDAAQGKYELPKEFQIVE